MKNAKTPLDGARLMKAAGFAVFPLITNGKTPAVSSWQDWAKASTRDLIDSYAADHPDCNWGVAVHFSGHSVLDVDCKGADGYATLKELLQVHGGLPPTYTVNTPSGGRHYYFTGSLNNSHDQLGAGLDTRGKGGYVVAPYSTLAGKAYEPISTAAASPVPEWIKKELGKPKREAIELPSISQLDTSENIGRAIEYLSYTATPCIEGGSPGGEHLLQVFYEVRDRGISKDKAKELVLQHYNPRCSPPWDFSNDGDQRHFDSKLRNAYRYPQNTGIGYKTAEGQTLHALADFGLLDHPAPTQAVAEPAGPQAASQNPVPLKGPIPVADFTGEPPNRQWLVKDWLPLGEISSMYGKGGSGKSLIALQLAYSVATGTPFMGVPVERPMPVLAVFCEDTRDELHRRINAIQKAPEYAFLEATETPIFLWPRVGESNDLARLNEHKTDVVPGTFRKPLEEALSKLPKGPKLLILDTLSDIYMGDENVRDQVNKFIKTHIGSLAIKHELTILLLAHPSRSGQNSGDMLSGSTAWENAVRNRLTLSRWEESDTIMSLKRAKSNYAKAGEEILLVWEEGRMRLADGRQVKEESLTLEQREALEALTGMMLNDTKLPFTEVCVKVHALERFNRRHLTTVRRMLQAAFIKSPVVSGKLFTLNHETVTCQDFVE